MAEVVEAVKKHSGSKALGVNTGVTRLFNVAWRFGSAPVEWQIGVLVPIFKKGDRRVFSNYRGNHTTQPPQESLLHGAREEALMDCQTLDSGGAVWFSPKSWNSGPDLLEFGSWEFDHPVHICFVDLEKVYDHVQRGILWGVLREYGVPEPFLQAIWSLYKQSKGCVLILGTLN